MQDAAAARDKTHAIETLYHDQHKAFLPPLAVGQPVLLQDPKTGLWDHDASIISSRPDELSYYVNTNGREVLRSRRMIRPLPDGHSNSSDADSDHPPGRQQPHPNTSPASVVDSVSRVLLVPSKTSASPTSCSAPCSSTPRATPPRVRPLHRNPTT